MVIDENTVNNKGQLVLQRIIQYMLKAYCNTCAAFYGVILMLLVFHDVRWVVSAKYDVVCAAGLRVSGRQILPTNVQGCRC